ncbi:MAG: DUF1080 domain-containing protein [Bernardetiaceae bacterium]|nr:DUF1080 domain-containing protein [Bernardetiaceae bacterium]
MKKLFYLFCLIAPAAWGQANLYQLADVPLNDLSAFKNPPANWQVVGGLTAGPAQPQARTSAGTGVLANQYNDKIKYQSAANLFTAWEHGDLYLETEFMLPKGSNSGLYFQSRYEIQLYDSWGVARPRVVDCGSIYERWDEQRPNGQKGYEGHPPLVNACLAPGLWQRLTVHFQAPRFGADGRKTAPARFVKVTLNGITLHENVVLSGPTRAAAFDHEQALAPLMIQGDHGPVYFRNMRYARLEQLDARLTNLTYQYYEGREPLGQGKAKLVREGPTAGLDYRLADAKSDYTLVFKGQLQVPTADTYSFTFRGGGNFQLVVGNQTVLPEKWTWLGGEPLRATATLPAGQHPFTLTLHRDFTWSGPGLGWFIQKPNSQLLALHNPASLPERPPAPLIEVPVGQQPEVLRSFLYHQGSKRTHCLSVGDPAGAHYSYDLNQAGLLQIWRGGFLNATDMWHERGEPQTASPLGGAVVLAGRCPVVALASPEAPLPDSLPPALLADRGYRLENGYPVFLHRYQAVDFTDQLRPLPGGQGLERQLQLASLPSGTVYYRLGEGQQIVQVEKGIYAVDNQQYYIQVDERAKPQVRTQGGRQVLLVEAGGKSPRLQLSYQIIW